MHKTLYIDVDEEITNILDRIKNEEATDIFLVVPNEASLTQGVINLKILKKETEKIGKTIMIATADPQAKKVVQRIGIQTKDVDQVDPENQKDPAESQKESISNQASKQAIDHLEKDETIPGVHPGEIGSNAFFDQSKSSAPPKEPTLEMSSMQKDPSSEAAPHSSSDSLQQKQLPANQPLPPQKLSQSFMDISKQHTLENKNDQATHYNQQALHDDSFKIKKQPPTISQSNTPPLNQSPISTIPPRETPPQKFQISSNQKNTFKKAEKFFLTKKESLKSPDPKKEKVQSSKKGLFSFFKTGLILFLIISFLAGGFFWLTNNYPIIKLSILPKNKHLSQEIKILAAESIKELEIVDKKITGQLVEVTIEKRMEFETTGETFGSDDGKARGEVTIFNKFSSNAQSLVENTRVLSKEGKLFHLIDTVTVPGMKGETPGKVRVSVIADKPGEDFNITASTFTIEGFKGNPKYEAFPVESTQPMTGGNTPDPNKKIPMVTKTDINNARQKTIEEMEKNMESEIATKLPDGKKVLVDSIEKNIESASSSHKEGDAAEKFFYTISQNIKAITFNQADINKIAMDVLESNVPDGHLLNEIGKLTYKKGISDFNNNSLTIYVEAESTSWANLDLVALKEGIAGKKENQIKEFLSSYQPMEKAEITFIPSWLSFLPAKNKNIKIEENRELQEQEES